jgi:hypothetical protein
LNEVVERFLFLFGEAMGSVAVLGAKSFDEEFHADECSVFSFWTFFGVFPKNVGIIFVGFQMPVFME